MSSTRATPLTTTLVLQKLDWPVLVERLAAFNQTEEGRECSLSLAPNYTHAETESRWGLVVPLLRIVCQGYRPPIGGLVPMAKIFRAIDVGQILGGLDLRSVHELLVSTRQVYTFAGDCAERCHTLRPYKARLYPLPVIIREIEKTVGIDGELLDTASPELQRIRQLKISLRNRIESHIRKLLHDQSLEQYLQDDFFTVRNERYVVPVRLDGRGRVRGHIVDTSASGQTLFMEPESVAPLNGELLELDLSEKLEIIRIFKDITALLAKELDVLRQSYEALVELDILTAEASLANEIGAGPVTLLADDAEGILDLVDARHPLIQREDKTPAVASTVGLAGGQCSLVVSGPNAGGKTVVLKTVGLLHLMAKARLLIPANPSSRMKMPTRIFLELGDAQSLTANLSTFSGHIAGLRPIQKEAANGDLVLLDELATGTDPQTGAAIAQAFLENLAGRGCLTIATTHFESLKSLAITDKRFRNASMEYSLKDMTPTYRLVLDVPGQSFGLEVAEKMGLLGTVIQRAKTLRGTAASSLDEAVRHLTIAREEANDAKTALDRERLAAEEARARFEDEKALIEETRRKTAEKMRTKYESEMRDLTRNFEDTTRALRSALTKWQGSHGGGLDAESKELLSTQEQAQGAMRQTAAKLAELNQGAAPAAQLPGAEAKWEDLRVGVAVYVLALGKKGEVTSKGAKPEDGVEVRVGILQMRASPQDLRLVLGGPKPNAPKTPAAPKAQEKLSAPANAPSDGSFIPQTPTNSVDLRGMRADTGLDTAWRFIDQAVMRGESHVIVIHGHGTDRLKNTLRKALAEDAPYALVFRPGTDGEGGDGVTVISFER